MASDVAAAWPGETLVSAKGLTLAPYTAEPMFVDDVRFSNGATVEHNVLGPGEVGHILRSRTTTVAGGAYAPADAWFAFNQVGSVVNHSNAAGAMTQAVEMDAWGNTLASAASGAWGVQQEGFGFQSKGFFGQLSLGYFLDRWYDPTMARFITRDPLHDDPNLYQSFRANPTIYVDPDGRAVGCAVACTVVVFGVATYCVWPESVTNNNTPLDCVQICTAYARSSVAPGSPEQQGIRYTYCVLRHPRCAQQRQKAHDRMPSLPPSRYRAGDGPNSRIREAKLHGVENPERIYNQVNLYHLGDHVSPDDKSVYGPSR